MAKRERIYRGFVPDDDGDRTIRIDGEQIRGRWVYGGPPKPGEAEPDREGLPVIPETVGEWTGLTDGGGTKIFEEDVLDFSIFDHNGNDTQYTGVIVYSGSRFSVWRYYDSEYYGPNGPFDLDMVCAQDCETEVIGNIWENPGLLGD